MFQHDYADVNGIKMHYVTAGSGDPVVFWHANFSGWYMWQEIMAELSNRYRVIAFDLVASDNDNSGIPYAFASYYGQHHRARQAGTCLSFRTPTLKRTSLRTTSKSY